MLNDSDIVVDITDWVERKKADPVAYAERRATEVFLTALGMTPSIGEKVYLKGGVLMGVVYRSIRSTSDIDFTTELKPESSLPERVVEELDKAFPRASAEVDPELMCKVQSVRVRPRRSGLQKASFPALEITIGYAERGSPQEKKFHAGLAVDVLNVDISFNEPVGAIQVVRLNADGATKIKAYSLQDIIAEKMRALLQQVIRKRNRRQDIYDLSLLLSHFKFDDQEKTDLLRILIIKCLARDIKPDRLSLDDPEVRARANQEWHTLALEIGELPDFDGCFAMVNGFYKSLPWDSFAS